MFFKFIVFISLLNICFADTNQTTQSYSYVDTSHKILSQKVVDYSDMLDDNIHNIINNTNKNSIDYFFKNDKFLDETEDTFIGFRLSSDFQSKYKDKYSFKLMAHIPLSRTKKQFNLFITNIEDDYLVSDNEDAKVSPEIGINYFVLSANNIKSKYSVGLRGINLFARARYSVKIPLSTFLIEPVQTFKYSVKDEFYEDTYIYIDKQHVQSKLFRIILYRKTQSEIDGMDYGLSFQYYWDTFNIAQTFSGNTKYKYIGDETSTPPKTDESVIVNNYTTSMRFRQNIWKKWFFYEFKPSVNFHKDNLYEPNYKLQFFVDVYFGNYNLKKKSKSK